MTSVGLISLEHLSFSCSLWHAVSRIWAGFPGIALLVVTGLKHFHLFSLLPNVFTRGLVSCHRSSSINVTPLAELLASLVSRKVVVLQVTLCCLFPQSHSALSFGASEPASPKKPQLPLNWNTSEAPVCWPVFTWVLKNPTPKPDKQKPTTNNNKHPESIQRPEWLFSNNYFFCPLFFSVPPTPLGCETVIEQAAAT